GAVCECLDIPCPKPDLKKWEDMVSALKSPEHTVNIALVGKYVSLHDAYLSVAEALRHGGVPHKTKVNITWTDSERITGENVNDILGDADGIIVPGGFGQRGIEGMITAIRYARENKKPYLGICLGMQLMMIEFARNVLGYADATSTEFDPESAHQIIHLMPDQEGVTDLGGTLRLGAYPCVLDKESKAYSLYGTENISERHRHRYEVNNDYRKEFTENGMILSGMSPDGRIVEMAELKDHPFYVATQAHPEFKSRPDEPHPLFRGFIEASLKNAK
nr:CTP synthase [Lachnospiraceae bacterium]